MQLRNIILGVSSALVVLFLAKLFFDSQGPATHKVDENALEQALSSYERNQQERARREAAPEILAPGKSYVGGSRRGTQPDVPSAVRTIPEPDEEEEVFKAPLDLKNQMNEANRLYDKADYEGAREAALQVLGSSPENVRMLRIVVSSSCIMAEEEVAVRYYQSLPERDKRQMARRCQRYGIEFEEAPQ